MRPPQNTTLQSELTISDSSLLPSSHKGINSGLFFWFLGGFFVCVVKTGAQFKSFVSQYFGKSFPSGCVQSTGCGSASKCCSQGWILLPLAVAVTGEFGTGKTIFGENPPFFLVFNLPSHERDDPSPRCLIWAHPKNENNPFTRAEPSLGRERIVNCSSLHRVNFLNLLGFSLTEGLNSNFFPDWLFLLFQQSWSKGLESPWPSLPHFPPTIFVPENIPSPYWSP